MSGSTSTSIEVDRGESTERDVEHDGGPHILGTACRLRNLMSSNWEVVRLAVCGEPVSGRNSLETGKIQGIALVFIGEGGILAFETSAIAVTCARILCSAEQGIQIQAIRVLRSRNRQSAHRNRQSGGTLLLEVEEDNGVAVLLPENLAGEVRAWPAQSLVCGVCLDHLREDFAVADTRRVGQNLAPLEPQIL